MPVQGNAFADRDQRVWRANAWVRFVHRNPMLIMGGVTLLLVIIVSMISPLLALKDPLAIDPAMRLKGSSAEHLLGTDVHGRDLFSRVVNGGRVSLMIGFSVAFFASVLGIFVGLLSGFVRALDGIIMRLMDGVMSIPAIMLAIALMALSQGSMTNVIVAITVAEVPRVGRLVRSVVLSLREQLYVEAAISMGARMPRIVLRHILPNALGPIAVQATFICSSAILAEAALSFIGAGTPPTIPSWGNILAEGRALWQLHPGMIFYPAVALSITVLAMNVVGDGLSDLLNPKRGD